MKRANDVSFYLFSKSYKRKQCKIQARVLTTRSSRNIKTNGEQKHHNESISLKMQTPEEEKPTIPPPQQSQPNPKKQKMSTTSTSDNEQTTLKDTTAPKTPRYKRRKIAIFFAYCGVGYQGMQKNPGAKTIEGDLEEALYQAGGVPDHDRGKPQRYDWARSARTDKGVSAVGQVVSGRFYVDPPGFIDRLSSFLPAQIRIFGYKRVTNSFNAKKFCDRRRYVYLIPVFALDSSCHRDRESVIASLGSGDELVKCLECSERGRKVVGAVGKRGFEAKCEGVRGGISLNKLNEGVDSAGIGDGDASVEMETIMVRVDNEGNGLNLESTEKELNVVVEEGKVNEVADDSKLVNNGDARVKTEIKEVAVNNEDDSLKSESIKKELNDVVEEEKANGEQSVLKRSEFCYGEKEKERFNRILKYYVGSHNFHNFTTRTKPEDPAARRYIISFEANTVVNVDGIDFVKCEVVGQSFMLHQIRKMIGLAVAVTRDCAPESLIETALQQDVRINVPTAPEVGLYLDECLFTSYNQKWRESHEELSMKDYEEEAEEFKMKYIYSHIASMEHKEGTVGLWLHSLNHRNYPDLQFKSSGVGATNGVETTHASDVVE